MPPVAVLPTLHLLLFGVGIRFYGIEKQLTMEVFPTVILLL